jgi:protein ImuA
MPGQEIFNRVAQMSEQKQMDFATLKAKGLVRAVTAPPAAEAEFPFGLGRQGLHEIAEGAYGDRAAATGFLLAAIGETLSGAWVWVRQTSIMLDTGEVPEAALPSVSSRLRLTVQARNAQTALWAAEEAVVSGAASLVIAEVDRADFTSSRRLTLASTRHGVPVILMLPHDCEGATAAASRWRLTSRPSAPNRHDPQAPGHPRWRAVIERCRTAPSATGQTFDLEWNDETLSLSVAPGLAAGPPAPHTAADEERFRLRAG